MSLSALLNPLRVSIRGRFGLVIALFAQLISPEHTGAETLTWGTNGTGGNGPWNTTEINWWNGSQDVAWQNGGDAIFGGSAGTVNLGYFQIVVSSITFNTPGYLLNSGWFYGGSNGLTIVANSDATINSVLSSSSFSHSTLTKTGPATLTISNTNFFHTLQINQGEYRIGGTSSGFFSDAILADSPDVILTFGQSSSFASINSLSGGGPHGGIVQPDSQARTVTLGIYEDGNFGGVLQDNGAGKLELHVNQNQVWTNRNTYTGRTSIYSGDLTLHENGAIPNSAITVSTFGTIRLDNSATNILDRISDSIPFSLEGGTLEMRGNNSADSSETLGPLSFSGGSRISASATAHNVTSLSFPSMTRTSYGMLTVSGDRIVIAGLANESTGIITPAVTTGTDWMSVESDGRLTPFTAYIGPFNAGSANDHVKIDASGLTTLPSSRVRASLNLQNPDGSLQTLDLGPSQTLSLSTGGILSSGNGIAKIQNGNLLTTNGEWLITAENSLTIETPILEAGSNTRLTKGGSGTLTLNSANTYTGPTTIVDGTLVVSSDSNLGIGPAIEFAGGHLRLAGSFTSNKAIVSLIPGLSASIDTDGFDLTLSGPISADIGKAGEGTLTLLQTAHDCSIVEGELILADGSNGYVRLVHAKLQASGSMMDLSVTYHSTLDIGGNAATHLSTESLLLYDDLNVSFGLGSSGSDSWSVTHLDRFIQEGRLLFTFEDLGGVATGFDYPLIASSDLYVFPSDQIQFGLSDESIAAGWAGTFTTNNNGLFVTFTSVPEPNTISLFFTSFLGIGFFRLRVKPVKNVN